MDKAQTLQDLSSQYPVTSWYAAPTDSFLAVIPAGLHFRQVLRLSAGGSSIRLCLSNRHGKQPLVVRSVVVGKSIQGPIVQSKGLRQVSFPGFGTTGVVIEPGQALQSDEVELEVFSQQNICVGITLDKWCWRATRHFGVQSSPWWSMGRFAMQASGRWFFRLPFFQFQNSLLIESIQVISKEKGRTICCIGDSLTDGFVSNAGIPLWGRYRKLAAYWRYPDYLGRRISKLFPNERIAVCNAGISGNRLLGKGILPMFGPALIDRFEQDALQHPNITDVIILIGINDLGVSSQVSVEEIKRALTGLIKQCKAMSIRVHLGTLPPAGGSYLGFMSKWLAWGPLHGSASTNQRRQQLNQWILQEAPADSVFDFDLALRNPVNISYLLPALDCGDHLHPSEQGYAVMANAIDLQKLGLSEKHGSTS